MYSTRKIQLRHELNLHFISALLVGLHEISLFQFTPGFYSLLAITKTKKIPRYNIPFGMCHLAVDTNVLRYWRQHVQEAPCMCPLSQSYVIPCENAVTFWCSNFDPSSRFTASGKTESAVCVRCCLYVSTIMSTERKHDI